MGRLAILSVQLVASFLHTFEGARAWHSPAFVPVTHAFLCSNWLRLLVEDFASWLRFPLHFGRLRLLFRGKAVVFEGSGEELVEGEALAD